MKAKPEHPVSQKRIAFCCLLFSTAFAMMGSLVYWLVLPLFSDDTDPLLFEVQKGDLNGALILSAIVTIFVVALGVGAVWFFLAVSLDARRFAPDHFSALANVHWLLWGGLTGAMAVVALRLFNPGTVFGDILQGGLVIGCVFVSYWIAFRVYPLPHQEVIMSEGENTP